MILGLVFQACNRVWCLVFSVSGASCLALVDILVEFLQMQKAKRPKH